jgi:hypothetical protein
VKLLTSDIRIRKSVVFDELLKSNFIGEYDDPIKHVAESIQFVPPRLITRVVKLAIECADYILLVKDRITRSTALEFEYSAAYHGRNQEFIRSYLDE